MALSCTISLCSAQQGESAKPTTEKPGDNRLCYVCHKDLRTEQITAGHEKYAVTCADCHGASTEHMEDEMLMTKPDRLFGRTEVDAMCITCHDLKVCHANEPAMEAFGNKWLGRIRPNGRAITVDSVCTDCHGTHNIVKDKLGEAKSDQAGEWVSAFNRHDLTGWRQVGDATWHVERGRIVAKAAPNSKGGDLLSEAVYRDCMVSVTFRAAWPIRAGVWLRSQESAHGPRIEIFEDRKTTAFTGSLLVPAKGLALINMRPDLVDREGWNTISIEVRGDRFAVWLNGREIGAVTVTAPAEGRIGLHIEAHPENSDAELCVSEVLVQGFAKDKENVLTTDDSARKDEAKFLSLFNGKDLTGWEAIGGARWFVEDGTLVGTQGDNQAAGDLLTKAAYKDFLLTVTYKVEWPCNTGIWFRYQSPDKAYQADILEYTKPECYSGTLYCPGKMFLAMNTDKTLVKRYDWNKMVVRAEGTRIQIWLNGRQVADVHDQTSDSGRIGFQVHAGNVFSRMKIIVREVLIELLASGK